MTDDQLLFRELRSLLQGDGGKRRFCAAILSRGQAFLANQQAMRIAIMASMPYRVYLLTDHWRATSCAAKERAGHRCQLCNGTKNLQTHHRTYERRGDESPEDLTVLCDECHGKFHTNPTPDDCLEPATSDPIEMRLAAMSDEEQMQCLSEIIAAKRNQQGIPPDGSKPPASAPDYSTAARNLKSSRAFSSTRRK